MKFAISAALLLVTATVVAGALWWQSITAFDSDKWKAVDTGSSRQRQRMVDDLLERKLLDGLSEQEVVDLLGPPTDTEVTSDAKHLRYSLGPENGIGVGYMFLVVHLCDGSRVCGHGIIRT